MCRSGKGMSQNHSFRVTRIYTTDKGGSNFEDVQVPLDHPDTSLGIMSQILPAKGLQFRYTEEDYSLDWHNAPRRQYIIITQGGCPLIISLNPENDVTGNADKYSNCNLEIEYQSIANMELVPGFPAYGIMQ